MREEGMFPGDLRPRSDSPGTSGAIPQAGTVSAVDAAREDLTLHSAPNSASDGENDALHKLAGAPTEPPRKSPGDPLTRRVTAMEY